MSSARVRRPPTRPGMSRFALAAAVGRAARATFAVAALAGAGCTVFDDAELPAVEAPLAPWQPPELAYLSLEDAVRACRWVVECPLLAPSLVRTIALPVDARSSSLCLHWVAGALPPGRPGLEAQREVLRQVAEAGSCEEALGAMWVEAIDPAVDPRCAGPAPAKCIGNDAIDCDAGVVEHCSSPRFSAPAQCLSGLGVAGCTTGTCEHPPEPSGLTVSASCSGESGRLCVGDDQPLAVDYSCPALGLRCDNPAAFCEPMEGGYVACGAAGQVRCGTGGARVEVCHSDVGGSAFDCTALDGGGICAVDGPPRCIRGKPACDIPALEVGDAPSSVDTCNGTVLRACVDGQDIGVDCAAQGLACVPGSDGASGHCGAPPG